MVRLLLQPLLTILLFVPIQVIGQITVTHPVERIVIQRDSSNKAIVHIKGYTCHPVDSIQAKFTPISMEGGVATGWRKVSSTINNGTFLGVVNGVVAGRYTMAIRGLKAGIVVDSSVVNKVGIGEVFHIIGHSNAQGGFSIPPAINTNDGYYDRISVVQWTTSDPNYNTYWSTGNPTYLPPLKLGNLCGACHIPSGATESWLWARLGDSLVKNLNVPVLFYSAAFGGSNMIQTYKAAYDIPFSHSFINYAARHPYVNTRNVLSTYVPRTGLRGILCMHGVNDRDTTGNGFKFVTEKVIDKTRQELGYAKLAWLIATSCWIGGECMGIMSAGGVTTTHIRNAQNNIIATKSEAYLGANLNLIPNTGRTDNLHFNTSGQEMAANLWKNAILSIGSTTNFLNTSRGYLSQAPPADTPILATLSVNSGNWSDPNTWQCKCIPTYATTVTISAGHTVTIGSGTKAHAKRIIQNSILTIQANGILYLYQ